MSRLWCTITREWGLGLSVQKLRVVCGYNCIRVGVGYGVGVGWKCEEKTSHLGGLQLLASGLDMGWRWGLEV